LARSDEVILHYFAANAWLEKGDIERRGTTASWHWEQADKRNSIYHLRSAIASPAFGELPKFIGSRVLSNLGNALSNLGRFVEAVSCWDAALDLIPDFRMALGNRGLGLLYYSNLLYEPHQTLALREAALRLLDDSLKGGQHEPRSSAIGEFQSARNWVAKWLSGRAPSRAHRLAAEPPRQQSKSEREYRSWCLAHRLFLDPLNDLPALEINDLGQGVVSRDRLSLPSVVVGIDDGPHFPAMFDQLKQEFVSARYLLYAGTTAKSVSFSDLDVPLLDTMDYPSYGLGVEKMRLAFRASYSLFDKIAFFLRAYLGLELNERRVSIGNVWYEKGERKRGIWPSLNDSKNLSLRGLYWLSKDLLQDDLREQEKRFHDVLEPEAQGLATIRNCLEHKFLRLHEEGPITPPTESTTPGWWPSGWPAGTIYSVSRREFEAKALKLLQLSRAALIYLSLGVHSEEKRRTRGRLGKTVATGSLRVLKDEQKR
jgi:tetratricopeptide (TPR) repeat protein